MQIPLADPADTTILMHRDAHFGGSFFAMHEYYEKEGLGASPDILLTRIKELELLEQKLDQNLSQVLLSAGEQEKVARSLKLYQSLKELYEIPHQKSPIPLLIADLILAEEENLREAQEAVIAYKEAIVPALLDLLRNPDFHDPIFPGYGQAPFFAAHCLGQIGDKRALYLLFSEFKEASFGEEEILLKAFKGIGKPAKEFFIKLINRTPPDEDSEQAAIALEVFKEDPAVATVAFEILSKLSLVQYPIFATYLILLCAHLSDLEKSAFKFLANSSIPSDLKKDMNLVIEGWDANS